MEGGNLGTTDRGCLAWPLCQPVPAGCTRWLCDRRLCSMTKSALEACSWWCAIQIDNFYLHLYLQGCAMQWTSTHGIARRTAWHYDGTVVIAVVIAGHITAEIRCSEGLIPVEVIPRGRDHYLVTFLPRVPGQ